MLLSTLRWVFTLFGAILAKSNLYKKTIFREIHINMKRVCLAIHPRYHLTETSFSFNNIPLEKDGISKLGNKIVFKRETDIHVIILAKAPL